MTTQRYYWHNIQINRVHPTSTVAEDDIRGITGDDFYLDGVSEQDFETQLEKHLEGLRASLRVDRVERATIWIHDYTTDDQGETIITEDFEESYSDEDFDERDAA